MVDGRVDFLEVSDVLGTKTGNDIIEDLIGIMTTSPMTTIRDFFNRWPKCYNID